MSDADTAGEAASTFSFDYEAYFAGQAARRCKADEDRPANKTALFGVLAAAGIVSVVAVFDGYGDSGQIESIDARDADGDVALPDIEIELASPTHDGADVDRRSLPIRDAIEELAYDLLEEEHAGWENNDGAYGEFVFDVAARTISLDHSRYTAVESYSHEW